MTVIFPSRRFTLRTQQTPEQALAALQATLKPKRGFKERILRRNGGGFTGTVTGDKFQILRDIDHRNSFLPMVSGEIDRETTYDGRAATRIRVSMTMLKTVRIFLLVWLAGVGSIAVPLAISALNGTLQPPQNSEAAIFIPLGMFCFGLALPHFGFWSEAKKAEKFLTALWQAEIELPPDRNRAV